MSWTLWSLVLCTALSGILVGYDTGVITDAIVNIGTDLGMQTQLSVSQRELIISSAILGSLIGALFTGFFESKKALLGIADFVFIAGAIAQAMATNVWSLVGGRFVVGLAIGVSFCVAPVYIQELAPTRFRGRLAVFIIASVSVGQLFGFGISAGLDKVSRGWRWLFGLGAVPAAVQLYFLAYLPDPPRQLIRRGEVASAEAVLGRLYSECSQDDILLKVKALQDACAREEDNEPRSLWSRIYSLATIAPNRRGLIVAVGLQALQQLCGFNSFLYYGSSLFEAVGLSTPAYVGLVISGTSLLFTLLAMRFIDTFGRRRILLWSIPVMCLGLVLAAVAFHFLKAQVFLINGADWYPPVWSGVVLLAMLMYIAAYAVGLGNIPWQQGELFHNDVRGPGVAIASATNWAASLLVGTTYVPLNRAISASGTYAIYAGVVVPGYIFCMLCYPETAGLSLEEVQHIFAVDFGVQAAGRLLEQKRTLHVMARHERHRVL
ncbi:general substrate transporter [Auricularia subglabra TFB-10046 SS5]|nr:general substrate transporter [Auricularia subglabra TFB-10046 SS5]